MLGIISGIVGLISFFTGLKSVLFICAIANFLGQLLMVISKQQKSLSTITGFSILGNFISYNDANGPKPFRTRLSLVSRCLDISFLMVSVYVISIPALL